MHLNDSIFVFGMRFTLLQDWIDSKSNPVLAGGEMDGWINLVNCSVVCYSQTWPLNIDMRRLLVFEYRYLRSISRIWCKYFVSNAGFICKVLGSGFQSLKETLNTNRLRWLVAHVHRTTLSLYAVVRGR